MTKIDSRCLRLQSLGEGGHVTNCDCTRTTLLDPNRRSSIKIEPYAIYPHAPWEEGDFSCVYTLPIPAFRPTHMRTFLGCAEQAKIRGIYIHGQNQLMTEEDAYVWDADEAQKEIDAFYAMIKKTYRIKTDEELQRFLDRKELSAPDPCRIDLPTLAIAQSIRIEGTILKPQHPKGLDHLLIAISGVGQVQE